MSKLLTPKEINNLMGRKRDVVRRKIRMGRVMQTNPVIILGRVKRSPKRKLSFLANCIMETI